jgi:UDP-N-acetylglucosamine 4,6-dehydratase
MVTTEDAPNTLEFEKNFVVYPQIAYNDRQVRDLAGKPVPDGFSLIPPGTNTEWLSVEEIRKRLQHVQPD